ncbi:GTP-binding protein [Marinicella sp. W31]|uniref:GTP-binding protein n=1 Tax=Marinicella sp. W31 TaxID=3023713 RepID=UPI003756A8EA
MHRKVVFIGGVGSGKTTIINELSQIETIDTEVESTIDIGKSMTTVGIDYGHLSLGEGLSLGLYGVPGQSRFSFVWDFVKEGLWGVVILVKNRDKESLLQAFQLLEYFDVHDGIPCVIGVTHADQSRTTAYVDKIHEMMEPYNLLLPIYSIDARKHDCAMLIMRTLTAMQESIDRNIGVKKIWTKH